MDWNDIKNKYPKALNEFLSPKIEHLKKDVLAYKYLDVEQLEGILLIIETDRNLYDYFDKLEIVIVTGYYSDEYADGFYFEIFNNGNDDVYFDPGMLFKSRQDAERAAFEKGFELREQILNSPVVN